MTEEAAPTAAVAATLQGRRQYIHVTPNDPSSLRLRAAALQRLFPSSVGASLSSPNGDGGVDGAGAGDDAEEGFGGGVEDGVAREQSESSGLAPGAPNAEVSLVDDGSLTMEQQPVWGERGGAASVERENAPPNATTTTTTTMEKGKKDSSSGGNSEDDALTGEVRLGEPRRERGTLQSPNDGDGHHDDERRGRASIGGDAVDGGRSTREGEAADPGFMTTGVQQPRPPSQTTNGGAAQSTADATLEGRGGNGDDTAVRHHSTKKHHSAEVDEAGEESGGDAANENVAFNGASRAPSTPPRAGE